MTLHNYIATMHVLSFLWLLRVGKVALAMAVKY